MGSVNLDNTGSGSAVTLSSDGTSLLLDGTAVGGSPDLYRDNASSATTPSATGANAVAIGSNASAGGANSFVVGLSATDNSNQVAVVIGRFASASANETVAIGEQSDANGLRSIALGLSADANGSNSISVGYNSQAYSQYSTAIGTDVQANSDYSTAIGYGSGGSKPARTATGAGAMALGGSYASGVDSFAAAIANNTSSYGAIGANSVAIGQTARSAQTNAVALGGNSLANGVYSFAFGGTASGSYSVAFGGTASGTAAVNLLGGTASGERSLAVGFRSSATKYGQKAFASGRFAADGDAQGSIFILRSDTTDATAEAMTTNNSTAAATNQIVAASDTCIMFSGTIVAMQNGAQDQGGWQINGLLKNDGGTTTLVNSEVRTFADGNGWSIVLSADDTNNALKVQCTGEASHNIRWVANIQTSEVTYA